MINLYKNSTMFSALEDPLEGIRFVNYLLSNPNVDFFVKAAIIKLFVEDYKL